VGIATDVTHALEAEDQRRRVESYQRVLTHLARVTAVALDDLDAAFHEITREIAAAMEVARVGIWLYERERDVLVATCELDDGRRDRGAILRLDRMPGFRRALHEQRVISTDDALADPVFSEMRADHLGPRSVSAMLVSVIRVRDEVVGIICFEHLGGVRRWPAEAQSFCGSVSDLVAVMLENQRRQAAERALVEQQRLLRTVIDTAPNLIFAKDRTGRFTLVNRALAEVYGTTVEGLVGKTDADFNANAAEVERFLADDLAVMDTMQERFIAEEPVTDASGVTRWVQTVKRPLIGEHGTADLVLGVATDITERKRAELDRMRLDEKLRQSERLESLGLLAGGVAHDFNNLLTPILAYAELLKEELGGDARDHLEYLEYLEYLDEIFASGIRARDLTAQLLAFGRKQALTMTAVDLNAEITQLRAMLVRVLPENITIEADLLPDLPRVSADRTQVHQILMNLAVNARDAMPGGGHLHFKTRRDGDIVVLSVRDDGHGMTPETRAQIFEPFFTTKALGKGTGLGLATVYGVVQQHRGTIEVESSPLAGTTFTIRLPTCESQPTTPPRVARRVSSARAVVLVVEDDPRVLRLASTILSRRQIDVLAAHTPERALELAREAAGSIDLLLTDVIMPRMNGRELLARLVEEHGPIPVIFMTGHAQDVLGSDGIVDPSATVLAKPFTAPILLEAIDRALDTATRRTGATRALSVGS